MIGWEAHHINRNVLRLRILIMIAYHGTNSKNAKSILKTGFRKETWFAKDFWVAVMYGGMHVFTVEFSDDPKHWRGEEWPDKWQFHLRDPLKPETILCYEKVFRKIVNPAPRSKPQAHRGRRR